jgi:flagellar assembly protein FliH
MSTWSDTAARPSGRGAVLRGAVLRGSDAVAARPARMDAELRTSPFAPSHAVDPRLTDPHLQDVLASARRQAVEQGSAEGHRAGYAAGMALAAAEAAVAAEQAAQVAAADQARREAELDRATALLAAAAEAFRQRDATAIADIEGVVTELALQIARTVLDRELAVSENPGREAVRRALSLAPPDCPATVRVSPVDAENLGDLEALGAGRSLVVVADPTIEPGGCVVDAAGRQVDARIGPALGRVAEALQGSGR